MGTFIRFSDIAKETVFTDDFREEVLDLGYNYEARLAPTSMEVTVNPTGNGFQVAGSFDFSVRASCSRCLCEVVIEGPASFDLLYKPGTQSPSEKELNISAGDSCVVYYWDDLPLRNLLLQQIYLELPEKILCREDCKGLCSHCGSNLNEGQCGCSGNVDDIWTDLQPLLPS